MKSLQKAHRLLMNQVKNLSSTEQNTIRDYGLATFNKTRFNSHLDFLRKCLQKGTIPKGLMVKPKLNVSKEFFGQVEKAIQSYCKQLVRICIKDCDSKFNIQHKKLQKSLEDIHNLNFDIVESVKKRVHDLNKDLYEECLSIKNKKFDDLLLPSVTHNED